jgi:hypothetical protein
MELTPGDTVAVTVTVFNPGPSDALSVTMPVEVTGNAVITGVAASPGVTCTQSAPVACETPKLLAGEWISVAVRLKAPLHSITSEAGVPPRIVRLRVEVSTGTHDPDSANNVLGITWGRLYVHLPLVARNWPGPPSYIYLPLVSRDTVYLASPFVTLSMHRIASRKKAGVATKIRL